MKKINSKNLNLRNFVRSLCDLNVNSTSKELADYLCSKRYPVSAAGITSLRMQYAKEKELNEPVED